MTQGFRRNNLKNVREYSNVFLRWRMPFVYSHICFPDKNDQIHSPQKKKKLVAPYQDRHSLLSQVDGHE